MDLRLVEKVVCNAAELYIGERLIPFFTLSDEKSVEYEIRGHKYQAITGVLDHIKRTGTFKFQGDTFYFKYDEDGNITDTGTPG